MTFQRVCAWGGAVAVLIFFGGFAIAGFIPPLGPDHSAAYVADFYDDHRDGIRAAGCMFLVSGMFWIAFSGVLAAQMRRIGCHPAAWMICLAATSFSAVGFSVPGIIFIAAAFRDYGDPNITHALNDFAWIFLVIPWPPFLAQAYAFAYAIITDPSERPVFPRWLAYVNIWAPLCFTPALLLAFFKTGPFAWNGAFVFWLPGAIFGGWILTNVIMLVKAVGQEQEELAGGAPASA